MKPKGIFASDIDNTLTNRRHLIPDVVEDYLKSLHQNGWEIVFLTGRSYSFAKMSIGKFVMPYHLGVQNGAEVFSMPSKKLITREFVPKEVLRILEEILDGEESHFLAYSGMERGDFCYYAPSRFSEKMLEYLELLMLTATHPWVAYESLDEIEQKSFPLIKCVGERSKLEEVRKRIGDKYPLNITIIEDSVDPKHSILLINAKGVSKGDTLDKIIRENGWEGVYVIGAGDDENDITLLERSDFAISMGSKCPKLVEIADFIGKSSFENGIIEAIDKAIEGM
jgi:HAD superfamily hydrolase (TIGR01484 family)